MAHYTQPITNRDYLCLADAIRALKEHDTFTGEEQYVLLTSIIIQWQSNAYIVLAKLHIPLQAFRKYGRLQDTGQRTLLHLLDKKYVTIELLHTWAQLLDFFGDHEEYAAEQVYQLMYLTFTHLSDHLIHIFRDIPKALYALSSATQIQPQEQMNLLSLLVEEKHRYGIRNLPRLLEVFQEHAGFSDQQKMQFITLYIQDQQGQRSAEYFFTGLEKTIRALSQQRQYSIAQQEELLFFLFATCHQNCQRVLTQLPIATQALKTYDIYQDTPNQISLLKFIAQLTHPRSDSADNIYMAQSTDHAYRFLPEALKALCQDTELSRDNLCL